MSIKAKTFLSEPAIEKFAVIILPSQYIDATNHEQSLILDSAYQMISEHVQGNRLLFYHWSHVLMVCAASLTQEPYNYTVH